MNKQTLAFSAILGLLPSAAWAQVGHADFSLSWIEVNAGTSTPVGSPNGMLEPGEAARLAVSVSFTPVGTNLSAPGGGTAPVAGFHRSGFSIFPNQPENGTWGVLGVYAGFTGYLGVVLPDGAIGFCNVEQPIPTGGPFPVNANPIDHLWEANWTPANYAARQVTLHMGLVIDNYPYLLLHTGTDPGGNPTFASAFATSTLGQTQIQVIPSPGPLFALAGLASLLLRRRRFP